MSVRLPVPRSVRVGARSVGVYEYGDPTGAPVFALHGIPACGAGFDFADAPARERGLRVIAPDRPGVGLSSRLSSWTVAEYPAQIRELADVLGIGSYAVWGYSGGGPYAVACAALPEGRVTKVVVAAGMGQVGVWAEAADFEKTDRQMLDLSPKHPAVARIMIGTTGRLARWSPKSALKSFEKQLNASDRAVATRLGTPEQAMALFTQAFLRGAHGVVGDYVAIAQPWGLDIESIEVPMTIFQGETDPMVPLRHAEELAKRVPGARLVVWPGAGHLGTIEHVAEVLDALT